MKRLPLIAIAILMPLLLQAASRSFLVTLTIRESAAIEFDGDVDPAEVKAVLDDISSAAIAYTTLSFRGDAQSVPYVCLAEKTLTAYNAEGVAMAVRTFCRRLDDGERKRFVVGGYIAAADTPPRGAYVASATVQALFQ